MSFSTMLITIFMGMFWLFRAVVALCTQFSIDLLGITAYNFGLEVTLSFATLLCIVLVCKRKLIGSIIYLVLYVGYFGQHLVTSILLGTFLSRANLMNVFVDFIAIILAFFALLDMLLDKKQKENPIDKKTDWYFKNEKYDEELKSRDGRDDNNHYKFY